MIITIMILASLKHSMKIGRDKRASRSQIILRVKAVFNQNFQHHGPSHRALSMLDALHDRIDSSEK